MTFWSANSTLLHIRELFAFVDAFILLPLLPFFSLIFRISFSAWS